MVAYAPDNPGEATLETGSNRQVTAQMRILLICFVLIVFLNVLNFYLSRLNKERGHRSGLMASRCLWIQNRWPNGIDNLVLRVFTIIRQGPERGGALGDDEQRGRGDCLN